MTLSGLLIWLFIGAIAGWLAGLLVKGFGFGLLGNIVVGIVGAFVGGWILSVLGIAIMQGIGGADRRRYNWCCRRAATAQPGAARLIND